MTPKRAEAGAAPARQSVAARRIQKLHAALVKAGLDDVPFEKALQLYSEAFGVGLETAYRDIRMGKILSLWECHGQPRERKIRLLTKNSAGGGQEVIADDHL